MQSVEWGVWIAWSIIKVWSVACKVWSVERGV